MEDALNDLNANLNALEEAQKYQAKTPVLDNYLLQHFGPHVQVSQRIASNGSNKWIQVSLHNGDNLVAQGQSDQSTAEAYRALEGNLKATLQKETLKLRTLADRLEQLSESTERPKLALKSDY